MSEQPDYIINIGNLDEASPNGETPDRRRWIGVHFDCCGVYSRIYRSPTDDAYEGRCPRCAGRLQVAVGPGGTTQRIFRAN